ncbi:MAG: sigma-70 family RNA polymerase sigma factor [Anaerolineae bacterium]|nr:sigma-70 family RNA polymerase sigma factor [Anaerolineae bacterium]
MAHQQAVNLSVSGFPSQKRETDLERRIPAAHDMTLVKAALNGDIEAFNQLVFRYQDRVYNTSYRIMGDLAVTDDVTQEVFITAFKKLHQFRGENFQAWIVKIAINAAYDELRRLKRRPVEPFEDREIDEETDARLVSRTPNPERVVQDAELSSAIEECFCQLGDDSRIVVTMADVEDYSYDEIAAAVNISLGTVKSRISRARDQLRTCLRGKSGLLPNKYAHSANSGLKV